MNEETTVGAKEMFEHALPAILAGDTTELLKWCADDVVFEFPFAPDGRPRRLEGLEQAAAFLTAVYSQMKMEKVVSVEIHQKVDPSVAIVEMTMLLSLGGGPSRQASYVEVVTARNGKISGWREYFSPLALAG